MTTLDLSGGPELSCQRGSGALAMSPKIQDLIEDLGRQRRERAALSAELEAAQVSLSEAVGEMQTLRASIAAREAELARSGEPIPEAFTEDTQLAQAERKVRILMMRAEVPREKLRGSQVGILILSGDLEAAWLEFGKQKHQEALQAFEQAARALAEVHGDLWALALLFRPLKLDVPEVVAGNVSAPRNPFINTVDPVWNRQNGPERREIYATLSAVRSEIERAKRVCGDLCRCVQAAVSKDEEASQE